MQEQATASEVNDEILLKQDERLEARMNKRKKMTPKLEDEYLENGLEIVTGVCWLRCSAR